jgi:hypothetical protein
MGPHGTPANLAQYSLKIDSRYNCLVMLRTFEIGQRLFNISILVGSVVLFVALDLKKFGLQNAHRKNN